MATFATESLNLITAEFESCFPQMTGIHTYAISLFFFRFPYMFLMASWGDMTKCLFIPKYQS